MKPGIVDFSECEWGMDEAGIHTELLKSIFNVKIIDREASECYHIVLVEAN